MKDAISLGVGEPDFDTPWRVRDEAIYSLEQGRTFYTSNSGLKELKEELFNLRFRHAIGQLENPVSLNTCKKDIARIKTILREKEIAKA